VIKRQALTTEENDMRSDAIEVCHDYAGMSLLATTAKRELRLFAARRRAWISPQGRRSARRVVADRSSVW
jgi:hypothetical protein